MLPGLRSSLLCVALCACGTTKAAPPAEGTCGTLEVACGPTCADLLSSDAHCGACNNPCASGATCEEGRCVRVCEGDTTSCGADCVNLDDDPAHCGACGVRCGSGAQVEGVCDRGECHESCAPDYGDCNGDAVDGCETHLASDADHCDGCGLRCLSPPHAAPACLAGACALGACDADFGDCDGDPDNGCEISLHTSANHCNACDSPCAEGMLCAQGVCELPRPNVLVCGFSSHDVTSFLPPDMALTLSSGCDPDADTQAVFVTRNGWPLLTGESLAGYVGDGGIVISERGASDELFGMLFEPVTQGLFNGSCADNIATIAQLSPGDPFWAENTFVVLPPSLTGCGFDVSNYPGITPLAGWTDNSVSLAYRKLGQGRLWLVEADWQDGPNLHTQSTRDMMAHMVVTR